MNNYHVKYMEFQPGIDDLPRIFECKADNAEAAREQCMNAHFYCIVIKSEEVPA